MSVMRRQLSDSNYTGADFRIDRRIMREGPIRQRKCSDVLTLAIFIAVLGFMSIGAIYGIVNERFAMLTNLVDADQRICGYNSTTKRHQIMYIAVQADVDLGDNAFSLNPDERDYNVTIRTTPVCIDRCPTKKNMSVDCVPVKNGGMKFPRTGVRTD